MISDVYRFILEVPLLKTLDLTGCPCLTRGLARFKIITNFSIYI